MLIIENLQICLFSTIISTTNYQVKKTWSLGVDGLRPRHESRGKELLVSQDNEKSGRKSRVDNPVRCPKIEKLLRRMCMKIFERSRYV